MKQSQIILLLTIGGMLCAATTTCAQSGDRQLKVVEHVWGFDGRIQPGQFNPLSILLDNQTDKNVEGTVTLQRIQGMMNLTGGQYEEEVFVSATARRWIQFYPYISDTRMCEWELSLIEKEDGEILPTRRIIKFNQPRSAIREPTDKTEQPPQVVILDKAGRIQTLPSSVKHLPENIFPPYATVTFGLHTVFLDHVPDWESPRQNAFMSWLKQGGRLQLLKDSRGAYPRFAGSMLDLNSPLDQFAIGSGIVVKHDIQRNSVTEEMVRRAMVVDALKGEDKELEKAIEENLSQFGQGLGAFVETEAGAIDDTIFRQMRELTLPEHAWWLIFSLALTYIGLIFPGCYTLSKKKKLHYLSTYAAIISLAVVFSLMFLMIGQRGYGEKTNLQTLAYARAEDDTHWSVFQWNAFFVTSGDVYSASADQQQAVFSTGDTVDASDARTATGNTAAITMRIPPFSSQTFVSRRRIKTLPWKLKVLDLNVGSSEVVSLTIGAGAGLPQGKTTKYLVLIGRSVYEMRYQESTKTLQLYGKRRKLAEVCQPQYMQDYMQGWQQQENEIRTEEETFYNDSIRTLLSRSLLDDLVNKPAKFELPADRVRLFVYTEVPEDFALNVSAEAKNSGRILFCRDVFISGGPAGL